MKADWVRRVPNPKEGIVDYYDTDSPRGILLNLRVRWSGAKVWNALFREEGKQRRYKLGEYPEMSLAQARDAVKLIVRKDKPAKKRAADKNAPHFSELCEDYKAYVNEHKRSWRAMHYHLDVMLPYFGHRRFNDINRFHLQKALKNVAVDRPVLANRIHPTISRMYNWALNEQKYGEILQFNPFYRMPKVAPVPKARDRVLKPEEITRAWNAYNQLEQPLQSYFKMLWLTGQRRAEVRCMSWDEIRGEWWTIPGARTKNADTHEVFLSEWALEELEKVSNPSPFVFTITGKHAVSDTKVGEFQVAIREEKNIPDFRIHTIRHTMLTKMAELKIIRLTRKMVANHKITGIAEDYDHYDYRLEKKQAWLAWQNYLAEIVGYDQPGEESD